jgi:hypothetical protein
MVIKHVIYLRNIIKIDSLYFYFFLPLPIAAVGDQVVSTPFFLSILFNIYVYQLTDLMSQKNIAAPWNINIWNYKVY